MLLSAGLKLEISRNDVILYALLRPFLVISDLRLRQISTSELR